MPLLYFSHNHLVPLHPSPLNNHHTVVHVHDSFYLLAQSLHFLTPASLAVICSPSESVSVLFVSSVCSLDSTYG